MSFVRGALPFFTMLRHPRSASRARAHSPSLAGPDPPLHPPDEGDVDLSGVDPRRMLGYLVDIAALTEDAVALGTGVPSNPPPDTTAQNILDGLQLLIQKALAQPAPAVVPQPVPTATSAPALVPTGSGKPSLKFPDPPVFEGDPVKLDPWLT